MFNRPNCKTNEYKPVSFLYYFLQNFCFFFPPPFFQIFDQNRTATQVKEVKKIIIIIIRRERTKNKRRKIDSIKRDCFTAAFRLLVKANLIVIPNLLFSLLFLSPREEGGTLCPREYRRRTEREDVWSPSLKHSPIHFSSSISTFSAGVFAVA